MIYYQSYNISYANQRLRLILNTYYLILISYSVLPGFTSNAFCRMKSARVKSSFFNT